MAAPHDDPPAEVSIGAGLARVDEDRHRPGSFTLVVDGTPQSHVDLDDPTHLAFEYVRRIGHAIDLLPVDILPAIAHGVFGVDYLRPLPTADLNATLGMAVGVLFLVLFYNVKIKGFGGKDRLCGNDGRDKLVGGAGPDRLYGQGGNDVLVGGPGVDVLRGGGGTNILRP